MLRMQRRHHYSGAEWREHPGDRGAASNSVDAGLRSIYAPGSAIHTTISATYSQRRSAGGHASPPRGGGRTGYCHGDAAIAVVEHTRIPDAARVAWVHTTASAKRQWTVGTAVRAGRSITATRRPDRRYAAVDSGSDGEYAIRAAAATRCRADTACRLPSITGKRAALASASAGNSAWRNLRHWGRGSTPTAKSISFQGSGPKSEAVGPRAGLGHHHLSSG